MHGIKILHNFLSPTSCLSTVFIDFRVCVKLLYNFIGTMIVGATSLEDMVSKLKQPRKIMLLVKAGAAVDSFINKLVCFYILRMFLHYYI